MGRFGKTMAWLLIIGLILFPPAAGAADDPALLADIQKLLTAYHVDRPKAKDIAADTVEEMLEKLGDPYTRYMTEAEYNQFYEGMENNYAGIGVSVEMDADGLPVVKETFPDTPASRAGIVPGDRIVAVEGRPVQGLSLDQMIQLIRGPADTRVAITIRRAGEEFALTLIRSQVELPNVTGRMLEGTTGYIRIDTFGFRAGLEFESAYRSLLGKGMDRLILDLRANGGGHLDSALEIADVLLPQGIFTHLYTYEGKKETYYTTGREKILPMVVLVDGNTASASEMLAGALVDRAQAKLVGTTTYGKGSGQQTVHLKRGGYLKITMVRYRTPGEKVVDKVGLTPHQEVAYPDLQLIRAKELISPQGAAPRTVRLPLDAKEAWVSGERVVLDQQAEIIDSRVYLPLRFLGEALGGTVGYDGKARTVNVTLGRKTLRVPLEGGDLILDGQPVGRVEPLPVREERTLAPVRLLSETFGLTVLYDGEKREVLISE